MSTTVQKLALGLAFSSAIGVSQAADKPDYICTLNPTKSVARIYELTDTGSYQFSEKSGRLTRSRGVMENVTILLNRFREKSVPVPPLRVSEGVHGEYSGAAFMYLANEGRVTEKYRAAIEVSVTAWDGHNALGKCKSMSQVDGENRLEAEIVPENRYKLLEPGHRTPDSIFLGRNGAR